jgi:hypothetical protein
MKYKYVYNTKDLTLKLFNQWGRVISSIEGIKLQEVSDYQICGITLTIVHR